LTGLRLGLTYRRVPHKRGDELNIKEMGGLFISCYLSTNSLLLAGMAWSSFIDKPTLLVIPQWLQNLE